jgi:probable rRNA maturation factor
LGENHLRKIRFYVRKARSPPGSSRKHAARKVYSSMPVEVVRRGSGNKYSTRLIKSTALEVLRLLGHADAELSLALIGDREIRKLNARYRAKDYATDVLSFPAGHPLPKEIRLLGDVVISVDKARSQAKERGRTMKQEMATLLIHGIVHLLGYDHERSARDARAMGRLERRIYMKLCEGGFL